MIGIDTNVLVRLVLDDPDVPEQSVIARQIVHQALHQGECIFINNVVIAETLWVLSHRYKIKKEGLIKALKSLYDNSHFIFESDKVINQAITAFKN